MLEQAPTLVREFVYKGADSSIALLVQADFQPVDLTNLTRVTLDIGNTGQIIDSDLLPGAFDLSSRAIEGIIIMTLGNLSAPDELPPGCWPITFRLFFSTTPLGLIWASQAPDAPSKLTLCVVEG